MGISYSWSHQSSDGQNVPCADITDGDSFIKREKTVNLELLNLDLSNAGDNVVGLMAQNQEQYVQPQPVNIYANGMFAGKGKLSNFSISEGSQTNAVLTNLSYDMGDSSDEEDFDQDENPVDRSEEITVSRDLKNKSYKIEHTYSVNFGSDFDLVSDYPLYKSNPGYHSVDARLALAENEANSKINQSPIDYSQYIDLSSYATSNGWDLTKLGEGCSGAFSNSSVTKDFINGNYSATKTTEIKYTGENISDEELDDYSINYDISWSIEEPRKNVKACFVRMKGTIVGNGSISCNTEDSKMSNAEKGYKEFVEGGTAKQRMKSFFNLLKSHQQGAGQLNDTMLDLKKSECIPSVNVNGEENNGTIDFSFEMSNDSGYVPPTEGQAPHIKKESSTESSSKGNGCNGEEITIHESEASLTIEGVCGQNIDEKGDFQKYNSIINIFNSSKPSLPQHPKADSRFWSPKKSTTSLSPYKGSASFSIVGDDARTEKKCKELESSDDCDEKIIDVIKIENKDRFVDSITMDGIQTEIKGVYAGEKKVSINFRKRSLQCPRASFDEMLEDILSDVQSDQPECFTNSLSWNYNRKYEQVPELKITIEGYQEYSQGNEGGSSGPLGSYTTVPRNVKNFSNMINQAKRASQ
jgi:hypothetical protein